MVIVQTVITPVSLRWANKTAYWLCKVLLFFAYNDIVSECVYSVVSIFKDAFLYFFRLVEVFIFRSLCILVVDPLRQK